MYMPEASAKHVHNSLQLSTAVYSCLQLSTTVYSCLQLSTTVYSCLQLSTSLTAESRRGDTYDTLLLPGLAQTEAGRHTLGTAVVVSAHCCAPAACFPSVHPLLPGPMPCWLSRLSAPHTAAFTQAERQQLQGFNLSQARELTVHK